MNKICSQCGATKYYCKGLCKSCYTKQLVPLRWCKKHDECIRCGSSESPHVAKGLCKRCYSTQETSILCACGCGLPVSKFRNKIRKYRKGHWMRNNPVFLEAHRKAMIGENNPQYGKFGKNHPAYNHKTKPEVIEARRQRRLLAISTREKRTDIEILISDMLNRLGIKHISQKLLYGKFTVDEFLPDYNIIIEVNGDYWHGDSRKYKTSDLHPMQLRNRKNDKTRAKYLTKAGHRVVILWETEVKSKITWCEKEILSAIENFSIPFIQDSAH